MNQSTATVPESHVVRSALADGRLHSVMVEFEGPAELKAAARRIRDAGFTRWDTHSPFPVHGIDEAMGIRMTKLPYVVFGVGALGTLTGIALQWWANASGAGTAEAIKQAVPNFVQGYPFIVSGKPYFSLPANIPIIFELTVLFSAFAAFLGMLVANNLPLHHHALLRNVRFRRVTSDRFFLVVEAADPKFNRASTPQLLHSLGGTACEEVYEPPPDVPPRRLVTRLTIVIALFLMIPPVVIGYARVAKKSEPRIHIIQDMDNQERYKAQQASPLFADGRAMRPLVEGTVARGELRDDEHFYLGLVDGQFATDYPTHRPDVQITEAFLARGRDKFVIHCAPCHGLDGSGNGRVNQRAIELAEPGWVQAASLYDDERMTRPVGHIFNTITNGIRTMPPYGEMIREADRWAIVAYVRALQRAARPEAGDAAGDAAAGGGAAGSGGGE